MKWFLDLTTRTKLFLSFGLIILCLIVVIVTAYGGITAIRESQEALFEKTFVVVEDLLEFRSNENRQRARLLEMILETDKKKQEALASDIKNRVKEIDESLQRLRELGQDGRSFSLTKFEELRTTLNVYRQTREEQTAKVFAGKSEEARQLGLGAQEERFEEIRSIAIELAKEAKERARTGVIQSKQQADQSVRLFIVVGLVALLLGSAMAAFLNRIIANPLKEISGVAERIALGDLTINVSPHNRADEVGSLTKAFRSMVESLRRVMGELMEGTNVLGSSASEILAATTQVASGAAETATAVSETTTTVEEVKQTAQVSSQKAKYVSESAQKSAQVSQTGRKSADETIDGMSRIREQMEAIADSIVRLSEQSQAIGEIIATVNDLADQSNLLAVNAAIEAAKAGEHGKGFAVVAQEVKNLAEQSKQATAQVRTILGDIQKATSAAVMATEQGSKAVEAGVRQSTGTGESIRILTDSIAEAAQAATQIAASSQQQLVGMDQVALAMENIKQASAQNVASTRQAEAAAQNLHELGQKLKQLVEQYQV